MAEANADINLLLASGAATLTGSMNPAISTAANIKIGDNPAFAWEDFLEIYPQFGGTEGVSPTTPIIPDAVATMYITLAHACIQEQRWCEQWQMAMCLFIAHYCTMYLWGKASTGASYRVIAEAGLAKGITVSKSAGDVSVSRQLIGASTFEHWGAFNNTHYGQQLATIGELVGSGGMYIW